MLFQCLISSRSECNKHNNTAKTCIKNTYGTFPLLFAAHRLIRVTDSTASCMHAHIPRNIFSFPIVYVPQTTSSRLFVFFSATTLFTMKETTSSCCGKEYWGSQYVVSRYSVFREGRVCSGEQSNIDVCARKSPMYVYQGRWEVRWEGMKWR